MSGQSSNRLGAPAALAGYRKQFLYTLHEITERGARVRVEGLEDLDILGADDDVVEVVQVKAYDRDLTLTHVSDFLERTASLLRSNPQLRGRMS